jgi:hypothetical protein
VTLANLPLEQLSDARLDCAHELTARPNNALWLQFDEKADKTSTGQLGLASSFSIDSVAGEIHFATDQSCIAEFVVGLRAAPRAAWPAQ